MSDSYERFDEEEFRARLADGDTDAWGEVFLHFKSRCIDVIVRILGRGASSQDEAEELYGKMCLSIWQSFADGKSHYIGRGHFKDYIFKCARNIALSHLKKNKRRPLESNSQGRQDDDCKNPCEDVPDPRPGPEERCEKKEFETSIMNFLPPKYREPFKLKFLDGYKYSEIASRLKISVTAVSVLIHRALEMIRKDLEPDLKRNRRK